MNNIEISSYIDDIFKKLDIFDFNDFSIILQDLDQKDF